METLNIFALGFYPPRKGGSGQAGWNIVKEMAKEGHKVTVFSEAIPGVEVTPVKNIKLIPVHTKRMITPSVKDYKLARPLRRIWGLGGGIARKPFTDAIKKEFKTTIPQAIIVNFSAPFASFVQGMARRRGIPVITVFHGSDVHNLLKPEYKRVRRTLVKSYQGSDAKITVSHFLREALEDLGVKNVNVVPNVIDSTIFRPLGEKESARLRKEHGLPSNAIVITHISTLRPVKRPLDIVEAAAKALHQRPNLHFMIVGQGPLKEPMMQRAKSLGLAHKFSFMGKASQEQVNEYLNASEALLLPSEREGMPLVILEAAACGKPCIASAVGGIPEIVRDRVNGLLFSKGNIDELANKLVAVSNPDLRKILSVNALRYSNSRSIKLMAEKYLEIIRQEVAKKERAKARQKTKRKKLKKKREPPKPHRK